MSITEYHSHRRVGCPNIHRQVATAELGYFGSKEFKLLLLRLGLYFHPSFKHSFRSTIFPFKSERIPAWTVTVCYTSLVLWHCCLVAVWAQWPGLAAILQMKPPISALQEATSHLPKYLMSEGWCISVNMTVQGWESMYRDGWAGVHDIASETHESQCKGAAGQASMTQRLKHSSNQHSDDTV